MKEARKAGYAIHMLKEKCEIAKFNGENPALFWANRIIPMLSEIIGDRLSDYNYEFFKLACEEYLNEIKSQEPK